MRGFGIAAMMALSLTYQNPARAQTAHSLEMGFLTFGFEEATFLLGYRVTATKPGGVGVDFSVATLPQAWSETVITLLDLDMTSSIAIGSQSWLLPRGGLTAALAWGGFAGAAPGFNVGLGLLGRIGEHTGARLDVTYMRFIGDDETVGITALTFGFAWIQ